MSLHSPIKGYIPTKITAEVAAEEFWVTVGPEGVGLGAGVSLELEEPPPPPQAESRPINPNIRIF